MENLLLNYFQNRMEKESIYTDPHNEYGPLVTITREFGCPGKAIAEQLVYLINQAKPPIKWNWIDKEILKILASELNLSPSVIEDIKNFEERKISDYVALVFSNDYFPGNKKIKNALAEIILTFSKRGHYVIVGRAGHYIAGDIPRSYHVSLKAPFDWRVEHICQRKNCSYQEALKMVQEMSEKRERFLMHFAKGKEKYEFDAVFDCSETSIEEICRVVMVDLKQKAIV